MYRDDSFLQDIVTAIRKPHFYATFKPKEPQTVYTVFNNTTQNFIIWLLVVVAL